MTGQVVDRELVRASAAKHDVDISLEALVRLSSFGELFLRWNERINLGGRIGPRELVELHFTDAFAVSRFLEPGSRVVDVGTGGGLPALPLAVIRPDLRFELWEPTAKKVSFLRTAIRELDLGGRVTVSAERMDPQGIEAAHRTYDVATSRATFAPREWLDMGLQLVRPGGGVLVFGAGELPGGFPAPAGSYRYGNGRQILLFVRPS